MKKEEAVGLFTLAGFKVLNIFEVMNQYWPRHPDYHKILMENPWWLVKTEHGLIFIGWRKRVISIEWEDTKFRGNVSQDPVTKNEIFIHAWGNEKALEYLIALKKELVKVAVPQ